MTAKVDYAIRALLELAADDDGRVTRDELAEAQDIPPRYLEAVLSQLRQAGLISGHRGASGGYSLSREPASITIAEISRAVDGPLALVQGQRPEAVTYEGNSEHLADLWVGLPRRGPVGDGVGHDRRRAAGRVARPGRVTRRRARLLAASLTPQTSGSRPTRSLGAVLRPHRR